MVILTKNSEDIIVFEDYSFALKKSEDKNIFYVKAINKYNTNNVGFFIYEGSEKECKELLKDIAYYYVKSKDNIFDINKYIEEKNDKYGLKGINNSVLK